MRFWFEGSNCPKRFIRENYFFRDTESLTKTKCIANTLVTCKGYFYFRFTNGIEAKKKVCKKRFSR